MHPYAHSWRSVRHRGGSRIFWFVFGAGAATFWHKSHEAHEWRARHCFRLPQEAYPAPSVLPPSIRSTEVSPSSIAVDAVDDSEPKTEASRRSWGWSWSSDKGYKSWGQQPRAQLPAQPEAQLMPQAPPHVPPPPMPVDRWDEQRVQALGKQATDTISELSEATLDSVLATVQSLKTKLAENRAQREQHLREMQALKEDQYKMFEEWKKQQEQRSQQQRSEPRHIV